MNATEEAKVREQEAQARLEAEHSVVEKITKKPKKETK